MPITPPQVPDALVGLPNVYAYTTLLSTLSSASAAAVSAADAAVRRQLYVFVFGVPFRELAYDDTLMQVARTHISLDADMTINGASQCAPWLPLPLVPPVPPPSVSRDSQPRLYEALVLRIAFLVRFVDWCDAKRRATAAGEGRVMFDKMFRAMHLWIDAHFLLMTAVETESGGTGTAPRMAYDDDADAWLRLSPSHSTIFHEGELPDLYNELMQCSFFAADGSSSGGSSSSSAAAATAAAAAAAAMTGGGAAAAAGDDADGNATTAAAAATGPVTSESDSLNRVVDTFEKACPRRCEVRSSNHKDSEAAIRSVAYFCHIKTIMAASFLGIHRRAQQRPHWRVRLAMYRLFFYSSLAPVASASASASATPEADLARAAQRLLADFAIRRDAIDTSAYDRSARVAMVDYQSLVAQQYRYAVAVAARTGAGTATADNTATNNKTGKAGGARKTSRARASAANSDGYSRSASGAASSGGGGAGGGGGGGRAQQSSITTTAIKRAHAAGAGAGGRTRRRETDFTNGMVLCAAYSRLENEFRCGALYYEQRRALGTLPRMPDGAPAGALPPPPVDTEKQLTLTYAFRNRLPCDERRPSAAATARDSIVFNWLTTVIHYRNGRDEVPAGAVAAGNGSETQVTSVAVAPASKKRKRNRAGVGGSSSASSTTTWSEHYVFQKVLTMMVRESLFAQLDEAPALHEELCARTRWLPWERAIGAMLDTMRETLGSSAVARPGDFLTHRSLCAWPESVGQVPIGTLYAVEKVPFMQRLLKRMLAYLTADGFLDRPVDLVMPREYELMMRECLYRYAYKRSYDALPSSSSSGSAQQGGAGHDDDDDETSTMTSAATASVRGVVYRPYSERIDPARPSFTIAPCKEVPGDDDTLAVIRERFVDRCLFPLCVFRATTDTVDAFNAARAYYHSVPEESVQKAVVSAFVEQLAEKSAFQFQIVLAYCRAVTTYLSIYTFALPKHLVDHQLAALRRTQRRGMADSTVGSASGGHDGGAAASSWPPPAPHLHRSLVCLGCGRFAGFLADGSKKNMSTAIGTDNVKTIERPDDDVVRDRVARRGRLLAPDELLGARSLYAALRQRTERSAPIYDQFCADPLDAQRVEAATEVDVDALLDDALDARRRASLRTRMVDSRVALPEYLLDEHGRHCSAAAAGQQQPHKALRGRAMPPLRLVARGTGARGEAAFEAQLAVEFDRRMGGDFLLLGHALETHDQRSTVACADNTKHLRAEIKKQKQGLVQRAGIATASTESERVKKQNHYDKKRRRDIISLCTYTDCSNQRMYEFSRIGRGLVNLSVARAGAVPRDFVLDCCACTTSVLRSLCVWRGDALVCPSCVQNKALVGGSAAVDKMAAIALEPSANSGTGATTVDERLFRLLSPSQTVLPDSRVPYGAQCIVNKCRQIKDAQTIMFGKEILLDTAVGNERVGPIYACEAHVRAPSFAWAMTLPFVLTASSLQTFLLEGRTRVSYNDQREDHLPAMMTRHADLQSVAPPLPPPSQPSMASELASSPSTTAAGLSTLDATAPSRRRRVRFADQQ